MSLGQWKCPVTGVCGEWLGAVICADVLMDLPDLVSLKGVSRKTGTTVYQRIML